MKTLFLCAGASKRMHPIAGDKCLLKFLGKTLLEHRIEQALAAGLNDIVIVGNQQNSERLRSIARQFSQSSIELVVQRETSGMADALMSAQNLIDDEIMVVSPSDVFDDSAYHQILAEAEEGSAASYLLGAMVNSYFPGGYLVVGPENEIRQIVEKPEGGAEPSTMVTIVAHRHRDVKALFRCLAKVQYGGVDTYEQALQGMINEGHKLKLVAYNGFWGPIKYPWHLLSAMEYFLDQSPGGIAASAVISEKATIEGDVTIDENVRVLENAVIRGPCYIGKNTVIGNSVLIRDRSHIGADCVVGFATEIKHSYIGDGCWFHRNYIGDSIIADRCSFGAGTVTANLRFDEDNVDIINDGGAVDTGLHKLGAMIGADCKTGINVGIMPGVRIGPDSAVGPHVLLGHDLAPNKIVLLDTDNRVIEKNKETD